MKRPWWFVGIPVVVAVVALVIAALLSTSLGAVDSSDKHEPLQLPLFVRRQSQGGLIATDVSQLDRSWQPIQRVFHVHHVADIQLILKEARAKRVQVSVRGAGHSMGGHTIARNGWQIDMTTMNRLLAFDVDARKVTVEAGMYWSELIRIVNKFGLSPTTMQSYSSFSIGGSVSVNAHGIISNEPMVYSIESLQVVLANGSVVTCRRYGQHSRLFSLIVGGFGFFGIIYEVTLQLVPNDLYMVQTSYYKSLDVAMHHYRSNDKDPKLVRVRVAAGSEGYHVLSFQRVSPNNETLLAQAPVAASLPDHPKDMSYGSRLAYKWLLPLSPIQRMRAWYEKWTHRPMDWHQAKPSALLYRNTLIYESAVGLAQLEPNRDGTSSDKTHILQEFFVPTHQLTEWIAGWRNLPTRVRVTLLNLTIRLVLQDTITHWAYTGCHQSQGNDTRETPETHVYAMVLYYRISKADPQALRELAYIHKRLADLSISLGGSFYLPYLLHYSLDQLIDAYPCASLVKWVQWKLEYDPTHLFSNQWSTWLWKSDIITWLLSEDSHSGNIITWLLSEDSHSGKAHPSHAGSSNNDDHVSSSSSYPLPLAEEADDDTGTGALPPLPSLSLPPLLLPCFASTSATVMLQADTLLFLEYILKLSRNDSLALVQAFNDFKREAIGCSAWTDYQELHRGMYSFLRRHAAERQLSLGYQTLLTQKTVLVKQTAQLLGLLSTPLPSSSSTSTGGGGCLSLGDGGRYVSLLEQEAGEAGLSCNASSTWVMSDAPTSLIEYNVGVAPTSWAISFPWSSSSSSVEFLDKGGFYSDALRVDDALKRIPSASIKLVTLYVGLHHFVPEVLDIVIRHIDRILVDNGVFVFREHDYIVTRYDDAHSQTLMLPYLVHFAHTVFNAITQVPVVDEVNEHRNFQPLQYWRQLLESSTHLRDTFLSAKQHHDPTQNVLVVFQKRMD